MQENFVLDKNSRPILIGDVLKVFHFIGKRNKKNFMYKQVVEFNSSTSYKCSHLDLKPKSYFTLQLDNRKHDSIEIVQSRTPVDFEEREKIIIEE